MATKTTTNAKPARKGKPDPATKAKNIHHMLLTAQPKLDKHGARLEKSLKAIMDGGDAANLPDLEAQVTSYLTGGVPEETKSTRRRKPAADLSAKDKAQIADEAEHRAGAIEHVKHTSCGRYVAVGRVGGDSFVLPKTLDTSEFQAVAQIGKPYLTAKKLADELMAKAKATGHLAKGVDGRNSPQSVAAHAAAKAAERKSAKPDPKPAKAAAKAKKEERKAERAEKAAPKADDKRAITILKKDFAFGKEGTARRASWDKCLKAKTVAAYIAAGGAAKYLPRWASAGAIKLG